MLVPLIAILALADGMLHFALDVVLFQGRFFQNDLSRLFLLNAIGYVVLTLAFLLSPRWLGAKRWVVDLILMLYVLATFISWLARGGPNPRGLGYPSKAIEVVLFLALVHWRGWPRRRPSAVPEEA